MEKNDLLLVAALAVGGYALWSYTKKVPTDSTATTTPSPSMPIDVVTPPYMQPPQSSVAFEGDALPQFAVPIYFKSIQGSVKSGLSYKGFN